MNLETMQLILRAKRFTHNSIHIWLLLSSFAGIFVLVVKIWAFKISTLLTTLEFLYLTSLRHPSCMPVVRNVAVPLLLIYCLD